MQEAGRWFSGTTPTYTPPSAADVVQRLGVSRIVVVADVAPEHVVTYSVHSVDAVPLSAEVSYVSSDYSQRWPSVMLWPKGEAADEHYPDVTTRVDDHVLNHLANVVGIADPLEGFASSAVGEEMEVTLDGYPIPARVYRNEPVRAIVLEVGDLYATYVYDPMTPTDSLRFVTVQS